MIIIIIIFPLILLRCVNHPLNWFWIRMKKAVFFKLRKNLLDRSSRVLGRVTSFKFNLFLDLYRLPTHWLVLFKIRNPRVTISHTHFMAKSSLSVSPTVTKKYQKFEVCYQITQHYTNYWNKIQGNQFALLLISNWRKNRWIYAFSLMD